MSKQLTRRTWVYINGVAYERGVDYIPTRTEANSPTFVPDITPFRSPVDGSIITGRASLREHNLRNNVVQTEELKGLPVRQANPEYSLSKKEVQERREYITHLYNQKIKG
jgi:hypothetical protein